MAAVAAELAKLQCLRCGLVQPRARFHPSAERRRKIWCVPCCRVEAREYYKSSRGALLLCVRESKKGLGEAAAGLTEADVRAVLRLHGGKCFVSGAKGLPLVLVLAAPAYDAKTPSACLAPVLRVHGKRSGFRLSPAMMRRFKQARAAQHLPPGLAAALKIGVFS